MRRHRTAGISTEGVLRWQSQPRQRLDDPQVRQLISHDEDRNNIYLFLRTSARRAEIMYAVIRSYSGSGASELAELINERKEEAESILRPINGFVSWTLINTDSGCATVTVCQEKAGTDESMQVARDWIAENATNLRVDPPSVTEGPVPVHLS